MKNEARIAMVIGVISVAAAGATMMHHPAGFFAILGVGAFFYAIIFG